MNAVINKKTIGNYQLISKISEGGFGSVYRVRNLENDRIEALKILHPSKAGDSNCLYMFEMEAAILKESNHVNIVKGFNSGLLDGHHYIAMEYVEGVTLAEAIIDGSVTGWQEMTQVVSQLTYALAYLHGQQIIHCDLKPENILLQANGEVKLIDFGLARMIDNKADVVYELATGTPEYTAPEVWGEKIVDAAVDIYALGCLLFELVTQQVLFKGDTLSDIILAHFQPIDIPEIWYSHAPTCSDHLLYKTLACEANNRYSTANELLSDLMEIPYLGQL